MCLQYYVYRCPKWLAVHLVRNAHALIPCQELTSLLFFLDCVVRLLGRRRTFRGINDHAIVLCVLGFKGGLDLFNGVLIDLYERRFAAQHFVYDVAFSSGFTEGATWYVFKLRAAAVNSYLNSTPSGRLTASISFVNPHNILSL